MIDPAPTDAAAPGSVLDAPVSPDHVHYAIGDVHGEAPRLFTLHRLIQAYHAEHHAGAPGTVVHLGDYVDRGPDSAGAVALLMERERIGLSGLTVVCLKGNHEQLLLDAVDDPASAAASTWLSNGGEETLVSYARRAMRPPEDAGDPNVWPEIVPKEHRRWLAALPSMYAPAGGNRCFVHAGISPDVYPRCPEAVRLWTRSRDFFNDAAWPARPALDGLTVVHGHTPTENFMPDRTPRRVNIDTGAVYGGPLTAAVFAEGEPVVFLSIPPGGLS